jgi:hypothetical protein
MITACVIGGFLGTFNGLLSRFMLSRAFGRSDKVFYGVWAGGFIYRLLVLGVAALFLWRNETIPAIPFLCSMVIAQFLLQLWPVKTTADSVKRLAVSE